MNPAVMNIKASSVNISTNLLGVNLKTQAKVIVVYYGLGTDDPSGAKLADAQATAGPDDLVIAVRYVDAEQPK